MGDAGVSSFRPAVMDGVGTFVTLAGYSTSGKTLSALRLARGLAGDKKIAAIDTEGKRMSHYLDRFQFDVVNMRSPFDGKRFADLAKEAEDSGYGAMVVDSFSLEWSGVGGVLSLYDELFAAANFNQKMSDICWSRAKAKHKRMANEFMQLTMPIIFCVRAKKVSGHLCKGGERGEIANNPAGVWKIEQDKMFIFDWTVGFVLHPDTPGKPRYDMIDMEGKPLWKCNPVHRPMFPPGEFISEAAGEALRKWRYGELARKGGSTSVGAIAGVPLEDDDPQTFAEAARETPEPEDKAAKMADDMIVCVQGLVSVEALKEFTALPRVVKSRVVWAEKRPELAKRVDDAVAEALAMLEAG
jgi:general stress protein YciG